MKRTNHGLRKRCDCPRRKWPTCSHAWHLNFAWRGKHFRLSIDRETGQHVETKADALAAADHLRDAIRAGTFRQQTAPPVEVGLTFGDVATKYLKRYVHVATRRERAAAEMALQVEALRRAEVPAANGRTVRLEEEPVDAILKGDVEAIRDDRRAAMATSKAAWDEWQALDAEPLDPTDADAVQAYAMRVEALRPLARLARRSAKGGEVGTNRLLTRLHHLLHWAIDEGFATRTPFTRDGSQTGTTVITRNMQAEGHRRRRLDGDEERRLLNAAGPHLRATIEAALETGCRRGETGRQGSQADRLRLRQRGRRGSEVNQDGVATHLPTGRDHQSALPRLAAGVWLAVAGDPRHVAQRGAKLARPRDGRADLDVSGDHGDEVAGDGPPLRDCPTGLHKPCTNGKRRSRDALRSAFRNAR